MTSRRAPLLALLAFVTLAAPAPAFAEAPASLHFRFGAATSTSSSSATLVAPDTLYTPERGHGFVGAPALRATERGVSSDKAFTFAVDLPEGNYAVSLSLGGERESATIVRAESRRLMLAPVRAGAGKFQARRFTVNVRAPRLPGGATVRLKEREKGSPTWDNRLSIEFSGERPGVCELRIARDDAAATLFLAGDSTVTDQAGEPFAAWGQMLPSLFGPAVAVANHAESGESLRSFRAAGRLDKILGALKKGDWVLIQFGHNDQKEKGAGVGASTTYKSDLKYFVAQTRARGGVPVLVTPTPRRRFELSGQLAETLGDYPAAVRQVAGEEKVPLIDLNASAKILFEALGAEESKRAFVHVAANTLPGQPRAIKDDTHFSDYGAYQLARAVAVGIREAGLDIARHLASEPTPFDPTKPDAPSTWSLALIAEAAPIPARLPTLYLIGDSTVNVGTKGQQGWGTPLAEMFDASKVSIVNRARGGRSSRTFLTEGLWQATLDEMKAGDWVLMQFGHNDGGKPFDAASRARGSLKGAGEETIEGLNPTTNRDEVVHTYGWYLRRYVRDARARGARPIVLSPIPRNRWADGKVLRAGGDYGGWARAVAQSEGVPFVDLNEIVARRYEELGPDKVNALFGGDWTHTNPNGAELNAAGVVSGLKALGDDDLARVLSDKGAAIAADAVR